MPSVMITPFVPPLLAQQPGQDAARHGGRNSGSSAGYTMCAVIIAGAWPAAMRNGANSNCFEFLDRLVDGRQVAVRIDVGVAMAGEVLDAAGHAFRFAARHPGHRQFGRALRIGAERALGDHRVVRVVVQVQHRREVPVEAERLDRARNGGADIARASVRVVGRAQRHGRWRRRHPGRAHHGAAFLVQRDQRIRPHHRAQVGGQARQLGRVGHVLAEQAGAAHAVRLQEFGGAGV
jgi:hypothetical protein